MKVYELNSDEELNGDFGMEYHENNRKMIMQSTYLEKK